MADGFNPLWSNPPCPIPDASGDLATQRGSDPNAQQDGAEGLDPLWTDQRPTTDTGTAESSNSVSGLPPRPARYAPADTPPEPPSLQDRNPGTIDQR